MGDELTTQNPTPAAAPAATPVAPVAAALTAAPAVAPLSPEQAMANAQQQYTIAAQKSAEAGALASQPAPVPPNVPHARLLSMIQGIGIGLSSFGTAMGTKGREGGAPEVQAFEQAKQTQKLQAQQAAQTQRNQAIQNKLTAADTAYKVGNSWHLLASMQNELDESALRRSGERQSQAIQAADFAATHGGMGVDEFNQQMGIGAPAASAAPAGAPTAAASPVPAGAPVAGVPAASASTATAPAGVPAASGIHPFFQTRATQELQAATDVLGADDPSVQKLKAVLSNPNAAPRDLWNATNAVESQRNFQKSAQADVTARHAADPLYKLENDPSEMTGDKAPAAIALLSSKLKDPNLPAADQPRVQRLLTMAKQAQQNAEDFDAAKERTKQYITDGDPKAAGALLQSGLVSPQELISSRKPEFAQKAFDEAIRLGGGTKGPDGKWSGGTWSAVAAESQYEYAKNPKTQNTLNLLSTMQAPGGSIDIAKNQFATLPGKVDEDTFNKIINGTVTEFGGTSTTNFKAAMTSLADEYAQVLQGGAATETTLNQAKDLIKAAYSKNQGAGAFDVIRQDMAARQKGMVRDNPALLKMYPPTSSVPSSGMQVSLAAAMQLPANKGKTADQVRADIVAHGHQVVQ